MSFSTLKTLAHYTALVVENVEKRLGEELMTNQQIWERLNAQELPAAEPTG